MAEIVKVPVVGNVKKPWLYAGGAAVAGIAAYAWWTRGAVVEDTTTSVELPADEFTPPTVVDSGISVGGTAQQGEPIARTNVEWRQMAAEQGAALGFTDAVINSALTKYLAKQRLTLTEASAMAAIVAILGQPPSGGPYSILEEAPTPPPPHTTPPPTTGGGSSTPHPPPLTRPPVNPGPVGLLPLGRSTYGVAFPHVAGATKYRLRWETAHTSSAWTTPPSTRHNYVWKFQPHTQFRVRVQAGNSAGWSTGTLSNIVSAR